MYHPLCKQSDLVYFFFNLLYMFFFLHQIGTGCGSGLFVEITLSHHAVAFFLSFFFVGGIINIKNDMLCNIMRG